MMEEELQELRTLVAQLKADNDKLRAEREIKCHSSQERGDPTKIISILQELYGFAESHVAVQEAFFSRRQLEGETLQEFSFTYPNEPHGEGISPGS